jgi:hypothetical protein
MVQRTGSGSGAVFRALYGVLLATWAMAACAPLPPGVPTPARGVPGFDTRDYPGAEAMRSWLEASPYRWVGYYLPAPCYTGTTWSGTREPLRGMGWGFAVLYVGEQDWTQIQPGDTVAAPPGARCTPANLTAAHGAEHAGAAGEAAAADGFPGGTVIFLNVERVERVSEALATYVRSWTGALLDAGRYTPGLYAHDHNVPALYALVAEEFAARQRAERAPLWVARQAGFDVTRSPAESGYAVAVAWQGRFNVRETWADTTLNIDVNVADSADPSRGR